MIKVCNLVAKQEKRHSKIKFRSYVCCIFCTCKKHSKITYLLSIFKMYFFNKRDDLNSIYLNKVIVNIGKKFT